MSDKEKQELVERIVEKLIINAESKKVASCWGEPALLLCDVINIINNEANTDYKRYWAYGCNVGFNESNPHNIHPYCEICKKHFSKNDDKQGCLGTTDKSNEEKPCEKYDCVIDD